MPTDRSLFTHAQREAARLSEGMGLSPAQMEILIDRLWHDMGGPNAASDTAPAWAMEAAMRALAVDPSAFEPIGTRIARALETARAEGRAEGRREMREEAARVVDSDRAAQVLSPNIAVRLSSAIRTLPTTPPNTDTPPEKE